ncbi:hypothetical protein [Haladaptatus sp. NG-WS-4]
MILWADDRGVTVQVGTILLFATLVVAMSLYQATAVPNQNAEVEFHHSERLQGQIHDARNSILRTGATGTDQQSSVTLVSQYPERVFFVNPPPASGTLRTTPLGTVRVENVTARAPETADYWDSGRTNLSFATRSLAYKPGYHQYDNAPDTVYENSIVYNRADDGKATLTDQQLVNGRTITLVTLDGSLSQSRTGTMSLDPHAVSPSTAVTRSVPVRSNGSGNVTIRVPTGLGEEQWTRLLEDQRAENGGYVASISVTEDGFLVLELVAERDGQAVTSDLRMADVSVGTGATSVGSHYVTRVSGDGTSVGVGGRRQVTVEVRDRYNNPISGATVNFTLADANATTEHELDDGTTSGQTARR